MKGLDEIKHVVRRLTEEEMTRLLKDRGVEEKAEAKGD